MSLRPWFASAALVAMLAIAAPTSAVAAHEPATCTVAGVAVTDGAPMPEEIPTAMSCFDSVAQAEQFIEEGGDLGQLNQAGPTSRAAAATVIVGKAWTGTSRSGTVPIHYGSGNGCYGVTFGFPTLASTWNNNVRSAEGLDRRVSATRLGWRSGVGDGRHGGSVESLEACYVRSEPGRQASKQDVGAGAPAGCGRASSYAGHHGVLTDDAVGMAGVHRAPRNAPSSP